MTLLKNIVEDYKHTINFTADEANRAVSRIFRAAKKSNNCFEAIRGAQYAIAIATKHLSEEYVNTALRTSDKIKEKFKDIEIAQAYGRLFQETEYFSNTFN